MSFDPEAVRQFLYLEARLLDAQAYEHWLELFDEKLLYWIPSNRDEVDPMRHVSIVYADRGQLEFRVDQLTSGSAWVRDPAPRLCRAVSNVEIREAVQDVLAVEIKVALNSAARTRPVRPVVAVTHRHQHAGLVGIRELDDAGSGRCARGRFRLCAEPARKLVEWLVHRLSEERG